MPLYYPHSGAPNNEGSFNAIINDDDVPISNGDKLPFVAPDINFGGSFDNALHRWTPTPGKVFKMQVVAQVRSMPTPFKLTLDIRRNGGPGWTVERVVPADPNVWGDIGFSVSVLGNGDYYEVHLRNDAGVLISLVGTITGERRSWYSAS